MPENPELDEAESQVFKGVDAFEVVGIELELNIIGGVFGDELLFAAGIILCVGFVVELDDVMFEKLGFYVE